MAAPITPAKPSAKLDPDRVKRIRAEGYYKTARELADEHGVHYRTIEKIRSYETWSRV